MLIAIVLLVAIVLLEVFMYFKKRNITEELTVSLMKGEFDKFDSLADKKLIKFIIKPFNLYMMKFNKATLSGNKEEASDFIVLLEKLKKSKAQIEALYSKEFYYYLSIGDKENSTRSYKILEETFGSLEGTDIDMIYNAYIEGGSKYLEQVLSVYKNAPLQKKPDLDILISQMYQNQGNTKKANKYKQLAQEHKNELINKARTNQ